MKITKKSICLAVVLITGLLTFSACSKKDAKKTEKENVSIQTISTDKVKDKMKDSSYVIVDTRINDAFNGWKLDGVKRGGHIEGAVDFSANWLKVKAENKDKTLDEALKTKKITSDKNIVLYDANGKDSKEVAKYLSDKGFKNLYTYDVKEWAKDESLPMKKYDDYQMIVPAKVVKDVIDGKTPETFKKDKKVKIVEVSWGEEKTSYAKGHVPTSFHVNTDIIEPPTKNPPQWMLASDDKLTKFAKDYGFTKDDAVIVTGEEPMAAYRLAVILRYMGVEDVRVLNGGLTAWKLAGYKAETESHKATKVKDFGAKIPVNGDLIDTIEEAKVGLSKPNEYTLVDNRTWDEHIGKITGYSYHKKKGRIPGSVYGYAGKGDSYSLDYYRNIDKTMRNKDEILALWKSQGIDTNKHLAFMCGSGWRAAEVLTYSNVMGLENTSLYSDGWIGWSNDPKNPVETGDPKKK
ncbi:rhodanese-like domain-containing protein [Clostridium oceanicum]|uniref:Rhodanese-like domain-containing protein n=1 Tax=Clostridium oceanicum TaxID=1543 RepID=A0ABP3UWA0_9CLOT